MIEKLVMLASYGYTSGNIGTFLSSLEQFGVFSYMLPFLLIFALVFGILSMTNLFKENKMVNGIIALVIGLMALQFEFVPIFFAELFPRLGIGLAVILVVLIVLGVFAPKEKSMNWIFFGIAAVVLAVILFKTAGSVGWADAYWWSDNWPGIIGVVFILALIGVIVGASNPPSKEVNPSAMFSRLFKE